MKKLFIKVAKLMGYEIIDQNNFVSPTLGKNLDDDLSLINKKSIVFTSTFLTLLISIICYYAFFYIKIIISRIDNG